MAPQRPPRRGSILVLSAFLMVALLMMLAFAIDIGFIVVVRTELQAAADAGALGGCSVLRLGPTATKTEAKEFADLNLANTNAGVSVVIAEDVQLGLWDTKTMTFTALSGNAEQMANAVRVTCRMTNARGNAATLFFGPLAGRTRSEVQATAIARAKSSECGKFIGVVRATMSGTAHTDSYYSDDGGYSAGSAGNNGDVCSNGPIVLGPYSVIDGDAHPGVGQTVMGSGTVTGTRDALEEPLRIASIDMTDVSTNNDNAQIPYSTMGNNPLQLNDRLYLPPGDSVTVPEGVYYFSSLTLGGGATMSFTGRTVVYVSGDLYVSGGSIVNVTEIPANLQLYCNGTTCALSGLADFHGVVYAPNARVSRSGSADFFGMALGRELILSGTGGLHADDSLGPLYGVNTRSILVE